MLQQKAIEVNQLTVYYDKIAILWDITFSIGKGEFVGIIGPNGAGKSTLLKVLLGQVKPFAGNVFLCGRLPYNVKARIAFVPQIKEIDWEFPIRAIDVVLMGCYSQLKWLKWYRKKDRIAAHEALDLLGMKHLAFKQINQLSGGQRQRLFLARAFLQKADLYLLDEPFNGIDVVTEKKMFEILLELKHQGKTILMVHHDLNSVQKYFHSLLVLNTRMVAFGTVPEVFSQENIVQAFGPKGALFIEAEKLSNNKWKGF